MSKSNIQHWDRNSIAYEKLSFLGHFLVVQSSRHHQKNKQDELRSMSMVPGHLEHFKEITVAWIRIPPQKKIRWKENMGKLKHKVKNKKAHPTNIKTILKEWKNEWMKNE